MNKLTDLRNHLLNSIPELQRGPDRLLTFVEDGQIEFWRGSNLSHQYLMPVKIIITDWKGSADQIVVPVLEWLSVREPGLDPKTVLRFETEILSSDAIDLLLTVNITERVIVQNTPEGRKITHVLPEPEPAMNPGASLQIDVSGPGGDYSIPESAR